MLRRVLSGIKGAWSSVATSKKLVGSDLKGNKYFAVLDDENKWKRVVEYKKGTWDPNEVPQIWRLWLHHQRESPPTRQEELDIEEYQRILHHNVKILEKEDAEQRKKELEKGEHKESKQYTPEQFFVTWKRKIQQGDGSIDVNTNKKP